ncbi:FtsX-like permease family protein [Horticoccus sp. 23ND18S-11]|uniref:FtsX-like permease family protein n=1 Tax=Horticoccus sp. 23ND18S-11 TaxID=3391832 RepID=UPI0039C9F601
MTVGNFILRSLRFHWRSHAGVLLGATLATAILVGALAVGDSVRYSLTRQALQRLGGVHFAVNTHDRFFRDRLADDLAAALQAPVAPVVAMAGLFATADGRNRVNHLNLIGADERFQALSAPAGSPPTAAPALTDGTAWANTEFARRLPLTLDTAGQPTPANGVIRLEKPTWLPRDAPLSSGNETSTALRVALKTGAAAMDRFSLEANQAVPATLVVARPWLQKSIEKVGGANVLLFGQNAAGSLDAAQVNAAIRRTWTLPDADLDLAAVTTTLTPRPGQKVVELRTDRVFLDTPVVEAIGTRAAPAQQLLTYFVNELRLGERATPYSFVTAMDRAAEFLLRSPAASAAPAQPAEPLRDDEIIINAWLADDLKAKVGDTIALKYYVVGPGRELEEKSAAFRVRAIIAVDAADRTLTPKIPGLSDKENCRDWDPGTTIKLDRIRPEDEAYWEKHHGTPKAFVSLATGDRLWSNRFGHRTALRWFYDEPTPDRAGLAETIRGAIDPAQVGLIAQPVRTLALKAARESQDFGGLFIGLSFFLIVAALLLMGLLFAFSLQQRSKEIGTLLAVGWLPGKVRRLFLLEGLALAVIGGAVGTVAGIGYTQVVLWALTSRWRGAIGGAEVWFHAEPATLAIGAGTSALIAWGVIWLVMRKAARVPARVLLAGGSDATFTAPAANADDAPRRRAFSSTLKATVVTAGALLLAAGFLVQGFRSEHASGAFFGAGACLLIAGLGLAWSLIAAVGERGLIGGRSATGLAIQNAARRRGRSLTTIGLLACGSFLVIAVGANRHDTSAGAEQRSSGTGGFALFGETSLPLHHDLNTPAGRENLGLPSTGFNAVRVVPLRLREGDDASCLNLNRAQAPRLLGVDPREFAERGAFTFLSSAVASKQENPWRLLDATPADGAIPAIGDEATVRWALGKKVGDTLAYTDERGKTFQLRVVGMIANSILQGSLIVAEKHFVTRFPSESGHRVQLIDVPATKAAELSETLNRALRDYGLELRVAAERLALFQQVENTYLTIFQALGGLGLLLGSVGLGVVVLRNAMERRSELALLRAVGFTREQLHRLILVEHGGLLLLGLACGVGAAVVAVLPALRFSLEQVPYQSLAITLLVLMASGAGWIWLAGRWALRGSLMRALRNE